MKDVTKMVGVVIFFSLTMASCNITIQKDKEKSDAEINATIEKMDKRIQKVTEEKSNLQRDYDYVLATLDSMLFNRSVVNNPLAKRMDDINKLKSEVRSILYKKNVTAAELARAKELIGRLKDIIQNPKY